jgi:uncharacterized SAM-binding protein YcdF (DUF218 family)
MQSDRHVRLLASLLTAAVLGVGLGFCADAISAGSLITTLEQRFPRTHLGSGHGIAGVIALGGNPDRIREAGRLASLYPHFKVVVTGAGSRAEVLSLIGPDILPDRVLVEEDARNTYENAVFSSRIMGPSAQGRWLLVTSASHMPRAVSTFRRAGFNVMAWPIFDLTKPNAQFEGAVHHECLGLVAYWVLGRSESLWPDTVQRSAGS